MLRVLVVDDEPDIRTLLRITLERAEGIDVVVVASGAEALTTLGTDRFDLVLLDVMMPAMDGFETLERIRALPRGEEVTVVFLTARTQDRDMARYHEVGVADALVKPFDPKALVARVREFTDGAA